MYISCKSLEHVIKLLLTAFSYCLLQYLPCVFPPLGTDVDIETSFFPWNHGKLEISTVADCKPISSRYLLLHMLHL